MNKKLFITFATILVVSVFAFFGTPVSHANADTPPQGTDGCVQCHATAYTPWSQSKHGQNNVNCLICHKLSEGTGEHPSIKYTVEDESQTCVVCHTNVVGTDVAGQLQTSKHGEVGLKCTTCHEPHSQGSILANGSTIVCDNCHKNEKKQADNSTHHAAGLNCINCHMGPERSHTLKIGPETCGGCHADIHSANRILSTGAKIQPITTPMVKPENSAAPIVEEEAEPVKSGINLPSWMLVVAGIFVGAVTSWVLFGREPGQPKKLG